MTNQVHFIAVSEEISSLAQTFKEAHRKHTRMINFRQDIRGHLFQDRLHSHPIDEDTYLVAVSRHIEFSPVHTKMARNAHERNWSKFNMKLTDKDKLI